MKTIKFIAATVMCLLSLAANAQATMRIEFEGGKQVDYPVSTITSIKWFTSDQGTSISGAQAVNLGLPSGTLWASCNYGASSPEDYGYYIAWGEQDRKSKYTWGNYLSNQGGQISDRNDCGTSKDPLASYVYPNNLSISNTKYDVAHVKWGGSWRMPTKKQWEELANRNYCRWTWTSQKGVYGCKVTSVKNGNSIFLPAAGYYYSGGLEDAGTWGCYACATPHKDSAASAYAFFFDIDGNPNVDWNDIHRYCGTPIRPVSD